MNIVHIDDNIEDLEVVSTLLSTERNLLIKGYTRARKALDELFPTLDGQPDLILLDLNMPGMKGHRFLSELRRKTSAENLPVVVLSSTQSQREIDHVLRLGANEFVRKEFDLIDYKQALRDVVNRWRPKAS